MYMKPITHEDVISMERFLQGDAEAIFQEVQDEGEKYVFHNNEPACVLISPEQYADMVNVIHDMMEYISVLELRQDGDEYDDDDDDDEPLLFAPKPHK